MPDDCPFCRIVAGEAPASVVRESPRTLSFRDRHPQAPTHVLVIPKEHHPDVGALAAAAPDLLVEVVREAQAVAEEEGIARDGYRLVFNTGRGGGQHIFHVHGHVLGGPVRG